MAAIYLELLRTLEFDAARLNVRERAYGEFIRAVKEQVTRPDFTDRERIDTFRLTLLNITLTAADWVRPIQDGVRGIIFTSDYSPGEGLRRARAATRAVRLVGLVVAGSRPNFTVDGEEPFSASLVI